MRETRKSCKSPRSSISKRTVVCRIAAEMKAQELESEKIFKDTDEVAGLDFTSNRVGKWCGKSAN